MSNASRIYPEFDFIIFYQDVLWQGKIAGVDAALDFFKADEAYPMKKLREVSSFEEYIGNYGIIVNLNQDHEFIADL